LSTGEILTEKRDEKCHHPKKRKRCPGKTISLPAPQERKKKKPSKGVGIEGTYGAVWGNRYTHEAPNEK